LEVIKAQLGDTVTTISKSVFGLLRGKSLNLGAFDLIYASGLYDYLEQPVAIQLTAYLLKNLKPGGKFIITNFLTSADCAGYLEAFMDWFLIYRTEQDMWDLFHAINVDGHYSGELSLEEYNHVAFLEITRNA
jgi:SAM-dependent methyltransferase